MKYFFSTIAIIGILTPSLLFAQTTQELIAEGQARINELLTQIAAAGGNVQQNVTTTSPPITSVSTLTGTLNQEISCPALPRNMYIGDTGQDVVDLQEFLQSLGPAIFPQPITTGTYGAATRAAVERFQSSTGIFFQGQIGFGVTGPTTRATIKNYCLDNNIVNNQPTINSNISTGSENVLNNIETLLQPSVSVSSPSSQPTLFSQNTSSLFLQYLNPSELIPSSDLNSSKQSITVSPGSKQLVLSADVPSSVEVGDTYTINWDQNGFNGFDLIYIEGYQGNVHHFFGATIPELETYQITIPDEFASKDSLRLVVKHNNVIKDSATMTIR